MSICKKDTRETSLSPAFAVAVYRAHSVNTKTIFAPRGPEQKAPLLQQIRNSKHVKFQVRPKLENS